MPILPAKMLAMSSGAEIGLRVRELREARGWSMNYLAKLVSTRHGHISMLETGKIPRPSSDFVSRLASALNVTIDDLAGAPDLVEEMAEEYYSDQQQSDKYIEGLDGVDVNLLAIKRLDPEEFKLLVRQLAERRAKVERDHGIGG